MAADEVKAWLDEMRVLLRAAELLVEWFTEEGTEPDEYEAFKASLDLPYQNLALIDEWLRVGESAPSRVSRWTATRFEASRDVAQAISPLLERIIMYVPDFILQARSASEQPTKIAVLWGQFMGNLGMYVCTPIWNVYPDYAPPDWSVTDS